MVRAMYGVMFLGIFLGVTSFSGRVLAGEDRSDDRVYQYVVKSAEGEFDAISAALETTAETAGWQVLSQTDAGVPDGCSYRARVLVLYDAAYASALLEANRITGPFAAVDRINLFEDENGTHVSLVNPVSINRTVLMDDEAYRTLSEDHLQKLRTMITGAVDGTVSERAYGQERKKGRIGKTMGVMAGGDFIDKLEDELVVADGNLEEVAANVRRGLSETGAEWGMELAYEVSLPDYQTVIFGATGTPMDSKSFDIVKAGSDKSRKPFSCPGLAHAPAYPLEIVVTQEEDEIKVRIINAMFRMKMYFEDAGMWAFMKNMGMPGSIQDELRGQITKYISGS